MARMIPPRPRPDAPMSEVRVFEALEGGLPNDWTVLSAQRLVLPGPNRPHEAEIDFIVSHRLRGYLVLEVKGGREIIHDGGTWWSVRSDSGERVGIKDPGQQAQDACHKLGRYLAALPGVGRQLGAIPNGWGVCFPGFSVPGDLGPSLPRKLILDASDIERLAESMPRLFEAAGVRNADLGESTQRALLDALRPLLHLAPSLRDHLRSQEAALVQLTQEQARALQLLDSIPRATIRGPAGTGKTLIAAEKARQLASTGAQVQLLCYNRPLADFLAARCPELSIKNFHTWARDLIKAAGKPFGPPGDPASADKYWKDDVPDLLLEVADLYPDERWDAFVVDEGQDFRDNWWLALTTFLRDEKKGRLYVFYDPNQNIYGTTPTDVLNVPEASLTYNCRNTKLIGSHAYRFVGYDPVFYPGAPEGLVVRETTCASRRDMVDDVRRAIHRLAVEQGVPTDGIVIMSPLAAERSAVWREKRLGNFALVEQDHKPGPREIRFTSLQRFKGLEADIVVLCEVQDDFEGCSPMHLYVGTSRAKHLLEVYRYAKDATP